MEDSWAHECAKEAGLSRSAKRKADGHLVECQVTISCKQDLAQLALSTPTESTPTGNQNPSCRTQ